MPKSDMPSERCENVNAKENLSKEIPMDVDTPNENLEDDAIAIAISTAEKKKNEGNEAYKNKEYFQAIEFYSEAINLNPQASYYGNRSAAYMMMFNYEMALQDARRSTQLDPTFVKGYQREAKCHLLMGEIGTALHLYNKVLEMEPNNMTAKKEHSDTRLVESYYVKAMNAINKGNDYQAAVYNLDRCIHTCQDCVKFKVLKAECLTFLQRFEEAQFIASDMLRLDGRNADAIYVRGLCLYYTDQSEKAMQHFRKVLELAPDHYKAKLILKKARSLIQAKEDGNKAFKSGKTEEALELYNQALGIDEHNKSTNSKLLFNRALVYCKLNNVKSAISDLTQALTLDPSYVKALQKRAKCYLDMEEYEEAVRDYEAICKLDKSRENKQLLQDAKLQLKKSKRKDYYKILGVGQDATEEMIKKAYRKRALLHHPDRHSNETDEKKKEEEKKFKELGEAYAVLSDSKKKARYDRGQDLEEINGFQGPTVDPNIIFQSFFGNMGGFGGAGNHFTFQFG